MPPTRRWYLPVVALVFPLVAVVTGEAGAQCPDGSPGCGPRPAARPAIPPLDEKTWIVLPFANLARAADADWLRDASVNLLYLDLSRWKDVHAIDDKRVMDLLRAAPARPAGQRFSLADGLEVARRAGAGRLVLGEFVRAGSGTRLSATVYDTRAGTPVRSVNKEAASADSLIPAFGQLARALLDAAPPEGARLGAGGASQIEAYRDYIAGVQALNRFSLDTARLRFQSAIRRDSTFALAHYKLSVTIGFQTIAARSKLASSTTAARFASSLPHRERELIAALVAFDSYDYAAACRTYGALVRADSSDVDALFGLGQCEYYDAVAEPTNGDSTKMRIRGNWNTALHAFQRVLALDPSYHLAFQHILDVLTTEELRGCAGQYEMTSCHGATLFFPVRRSGDSLLIGPVPSRDIAGRVRALQLEEAVQTRTRELNLEEALRTAQRWAGGAPDEARAQTAVARALLLLGRPGEADSVLARTWDRLTAAERRDPLVDRLEIFVKLGRGREALRQFATMRVASPTAVLREIGAVFGQMADVDALPLRGADSRTGEPFVRNPYLKMMPRIGLGMRGDTVVALERMLSRVGAGGRPCSSACLVATAAPSLMFGLRYPRTEWPYRPPSAADEPGLAPALAIARQDTAALRSAARSLEDRGARATASRLPDDGFTMIAADAFLLLGDSASALRLARRMLDSAVLYTPLRRNLGRQYIPAGFLIPRAMLLRADLAAALGFRDEARLWYIRFLDLWAEADLEFQPVVERARRALAALGAA